MFPVLLLTVLSVGLVFPALATKGSYPGTNGKIAFDDNDPNTPYDSEIFVMDNDGTNIEQLTHNDVFDNNPCWSPDGTKIAFKHGDEIWIMDADGSNPRQLTTPPDNFFDNEPAWSTDGSKIAYTRIRFAGGSFVVFVIDADGPAGVGTMLINDAVHPSWSPDGSEISYNYQGIIYVADANTGTLKRTLGNGEQSCWSPDGTKIAFEYYEIWVMDAADGLNRKQLSNSPVDYEDTEPNWSPDGTKIVFDRHEDSIWIRNADGPAGQGTLLIQNAENPSWSPDGSEISYDYQGIIYVADASTGTLKRTLGSGVKSCWSPDGTKIVFEVDDVIWVMDAADGLNRKQLSNPPTENHFDYEPNWSPDGAKIVFQREEDSIWIMDADGTNEYDLTPSLPGADAPDYQRLLPTIYVDAPSTVKVSTEFDIIISIRDIPPGWKMTFLDLIAQWDPNDLEYIECELLTSWQGECKNISTSYWWGSSSDPSGWTEDAAWFRIRFHCLRSGPAPITVSTGVATIFLKPLIDGDQVATFPESVTVTVQQVSTPVGGVASPVNKLELIAPYLALTGLIVAVSTIFVIKRRKA